MQTSSATSRTCTNESNGERIGHCRHGERTYPSRMVGSAHSRSIVNAQQLSREHGAVDVTKHISVVDTHGAKIICVFPFLNNDLVGFAHGIFEARLHNPARDNSGLGMKRLPGRDAKRRFNFQVWLYGKSS